VILDADLLGCRRAQRGDSDRQGVMRVVLVRRLGAKQPNPCRQLRLHIEHPLTSGHQLLGEQVAETGGVFHRPRTLREPFRPPQQPLELLRPRPHSKLGQAALAGVDRDRRVRALVRVYTDHHRHRCSFVVEEVKP